MESGNDLAVIFQICSGETEGNVGGIVDGIFNLPLTDVGRKQASAAAEALKDVPFAAVYCSDLVRAADTAAEIARVNLHFHGDVVKMECLRERSFGCLEGKDWKDFRGHPKYDGWPGTFTPDGGETWPVVRDRIKTFFKVRSLTWVGSGRLYFVNSLRNVATFQIFLSDVTAAQRSTSESGASSPTYLVVR